MCRSYAAMDAARQRTLEANRGNFGRIARQLDKLERAERRRRKEKEARRLYDLAKM